MTPAPLRLRLFIRISTPAPLLLSAPVQHWLVRLWVAVNPTWSAQSLEARSSLVNGCMSGDLVFWKGIERLAIGVTIIIHKKGDRN